MPLDFSQLDIAVTKLTDARAAVEAYIAGIGQVMIDNAANQAKITALGTQLVENAEAITNDIVLAGTPVAP
jgi:hypothetical protein